jgi:hypothetical protein
MNPVFKVGWARYFNLFLFLPKHDAKTCEMQTEEKAAVYVLPAGDHKKVIFNSLTVTSYQIYL